MTTTWRGWLLLLLAVFAAKIVSGCTFGLHSPWDNRICDWLDWMLAGNLGYLLRAREAARAAGATA